MDALSQLLSLYPVYTTLDTRCSSSVTWAMERAALPPGAAPYHLVVKGGAVVRIDGQRTLQLNAGDMLLLPRGQPHALAIGERMPVGTTTDILCGQFHFGMTASGSLADSLPDVMLVRTDAGSGFTGLQALMHLLRDEADSTEPGVGAVVSHLASALLTLFLRAWLKQADVGHGLMGLLVDHRLAPALQAMLRAPEHDWSLDQLARLCHMSRSTFLRAFRKVSGVTPGALLMRVRMTKAAASLDQAHRGIGDVGASVGYQSEAAFQRAFKRYTGKGPGQYRRERMRSRGVLPDPQDCRDG